MKILVYSDLHLDHRPFSAVMDDGRRVDAEADLVVLAGDIHEGTRGIRWARETFPDKCVIYVAGNHEYYGQHWTKHLDDMRDATNKWDVDFLEADGLDVGGVRFLGCSLWTNFELSGVDRKAASLLRAKAGMNDYKSIAISRLPELHWINGKSLVPELTVMRHEGSVKWLEGKLDKGDPAKTVVITHHAPHPNSIPARYRDHHLSPAYASDLSHLMGKAGLWIHGHIHDPMDYAVNGTRVISNPRGYMHKNGGYENPRFKMDGIWEV